MARLPSISKYYAVCRVGAAALALSHVHIMLTPSIGIRLIPVIVSGCGMPAASLKVGNVYDVMELTSSKPPPRIHG
jgi:hypothetical protein